MGLELQYLVEEIIHFRAETSIVISDVLKGVLRKGSCTVSVLLSPYRGHQVTGTLLPSASTRHASESSKKCAYAYLS